MHLKLFLNDCYYHWCSGPSPLFIWSLGIFAPAKVTKGLTAKYEIKVAQPSAVPEEKPPTMFLRPWFRSKHNSTDYLNLWDAAVKQGRRRASAESMNCWFPAGPSADCIPLKRIKTEPPDGEIIQVTVPGECFGAGGWGRCVCVWAWPQSGRNPEQSKHGPWVFYIWGPWRVELAAPAAEQRESDETKRFISSQQLPNNCAKLKLCLENFPGDWTKACRENCDGKSLAVKVTWHICQQ